MKFFSKKKKIVVLIAGIIIILSLNFFQKEVKGFFYSFSSPLQQSLWGAGNGASEILTGIFSAKSLGREAIYLRLQNQALLAENVSLKELGRENETLRAALNLGLHEEFRLEMAEITGKDIGQDSLLIDAGSGEGIGKDMAVITDRKVLLGRIVEVYQNFSRVELISNKGSAFDAVLSNTDIAGVVKGNGNLTLFLDLVPREKEMKEGDLVVSTAWGGIYPEGLLVGLVGKIEKSDTSAFQRAEIKPFFNLGQTDKVFIILD